MKREAIMKYKKEAEQSKWFDGKVTEKDNRIIQLSTALLEAEKMLEDARKEVVRMKFQLGVGI